MWNKQQDCRAEKELRYSIRKYKFGAASVAIAALMFLGAHVASADTVNGKSQSTADLVKVKDESPQDGTDKPENIEESKETAENKVDVELNPVKHEKPTTTENLLKTADKSQLRTVLEELNGLLSTSLNLDSSLLSSIKDRVQRGQAILSSADAVQKDVDELASLLKSDVATLSQANKESNRPKEELANDKTESTESEAKKKSDESSNKENEIPTNKNDSLKLSLEQLKAALLALPDHETTKEVLEKANEVISLAQGAVSNTGVTTSELEDLNKRVKRTFNSVKIATMRLTSGARDSRNGQSIPRGTQFRAYTATSSSGALKNVRYFASVDKNTNGGSDTRNDDPEFTERKTVIKSKYEQNSSGKWMVYDVYFNNNGVSMVEQSYGQHYYFQPPFNIMDPSNTVRDLTITRYQNVDGNPNRKLSDGGSGFQKYGETITITDPWNQKDKIFAGDRRSMYDPRSGVTRENQKWDVFKNNKTDTYLDEIVRKTDGNYTGRVSYTLGMEVGKPNAPLAIHMTARVKLKDSVTEQEAGAYGRVYAASVTSGPTTNQSYIVGSLGTSLAPRDTTPPTINANGATVTKKEPITPIPVTAVDNTGGVGMRPNNPIEVTGLPQGLTFTNGKITGTPTGPVGNSTVTIKAHDKNGNKAEKTITITVKDQASKYNPTGETLTVNQGQTISDDAVKSKVKKYAPGSLTVLSKPSTAKPGNVGNAVVKVTYPDGSSENVNVPVTVLEAPDNQPPTLAISPANQTVVEGDKVTFTVTAKDNKVVTIDGKDFTSKYGTRLLSGKATNKNVKITDTEKVTTITITTTAEDVGKTNTITFNASDNAGNKAKPVTFTFNVTSRDTIPPTITANGATVTKNEPIAPISVTAVDNPGGVGLREKNPIEVTGLPTGLTYANNRITGTPTAGKGDYPVTITAYDKNGNHNTSNITIKVQEQADKYNPTGETLTVNQGQAISDDAVKAKVKNFAPGTLTVQSKPTSTATAGSAGNAVVKVTYPDGSHDTVTVPVTVRDVTGPTITAEETTVTKNEEIIPIPITAEDNTGGVGMRETNPITVSNLPAGLTYSNGNITGKTSVRKGFYTLTITAYDKNNTPSTKKVKINVQEQADKYTPTATELTVNQNEDITIEKLTPKVNNPGKGTLSLVSKPSTATAGSPGNAVVKVTYSDGSHDLVNVPITVKDVTGPTITANNATVTNREDITPISVTAKDNTGGVGMRKTNPIVVTGLPEGLTYADGKITGKPTGTAGESTVTITAYDKNDNPSTTTIKITVQSQADTHNPRGERLTVDQNHVIEDSEVITKVKDYAPATKLKVKSKPTTAVVGNPEDAVVTVTYPDGSSEDVNVPVTVRDVSVPDTEGPTITAEGATVTKNEPIKPILVTAEDNPGGVGLRDDNPIVVDGLPNGLTFKDGKITGTPTAPAGDYPVTITAYDKNGNPTTTNITIKVQEQKDKYTPKGEGLTVNQGHEITDDEVKAKVKDFAPGTLTVTSKPSTATTDNVPNAVVTVTYPDGSSETVDVPVTVKDVTGPTITADGATVTRNEPITPIPVNVSDNEGGRGLREENPVEVTGLPDGLTYANGEITGTPAKTAEKGGYTVTIKATDKDGNSTEKQITITVQTQADKYNPTGDSLKVDQGHTITDDEVTGKVKDNGPGELTVTSTPSTSTFGDAGNAIVKVTYPDGSTDEVKVPVTVSDVTGPKVTADGATVTKNEPITPIKVTVKDNEGGRGLREENPVEVTGLPDGLTYANGAITGTPTAPKGDYLVTIKAYDKDGNETTETITIKVQEQADKYNPTGEGLTVDQNHVIEDSEVIAKVKGNGPGTVTVISKPSTATKGNVGNAVAKVTYPDGSSEEVTVPVTVNDVTGPTITAEGATVTKNEPITPIPVTVTDNEGGSGLREENPVEVTDLPEGLTYANGQITGTPTGNKGDYTVTIKAHDKDGNVTTQTITITVQEQADKYNPKYDDGSGIPGAKVEVPVKEEAGKTIPEGTKFESLTPGITVDDKGKVTVTIPEDKEPGAEIPGTIKVTYPDGSKEEVPVKVTVTTPDRDIYTPKYDDGEGKPGGTVELPLKEKAGKEIPEGTKFQSDNPGITVGKDGTVTVTIPEGAKPGDKITGTITVTYPDGSKDEVPVEVTVREKDKDIYTPEYDKGNGKPGSKVEIPVNPDSNGGSGQDTPAPTPAPTTPIPDAVTPNADQVDPQTTIDNGAKSNDSQNVLPNTGTESNAALASLGLLGLLSGFGLVACKKKED